MPQRTARARTLVGELFHRQAFRVQHCGRNGTFVALGSLSADNPFAESAGCAEKIAMNEHDDDLESEVIDDAQKEADRFPNTGEELDDGSDEQEDEDPPVDDDPAEL